MTTGRKRGAKKFGHVATPSTKPPSDKDLHRLGLPGRHDQGMGTAGRSGGGKSAGGKGQKPQSNAAGADRGGRRSGGGKPAGKRQK
jgi:hypothetical protein